MLNDHDLLHGGVQDVVIENQANARRWARLVELHRRQPDTDGDFSMTAREWTALKASEVWATGDRHARHELNVALFLHEHLPDVWALCQQGALDRARAVTIVDILRHRLDDPADWARCGERIGRYLAKRLSRYDDLGVALVTCTVTHLRNKLNYETRVLRSPDRPDLAVRRGRAAHLRPPAATGPPPSASSTTSWCGHSARPAPTTCSRCAAGTTSASTPARSGQTWTGSTPPEVIRSGAWSRQGE